MLQHRGQDSAGMVTTDGERFREHRDNGLVREVFGSQSLLNMMSGDCLATCQRCSSQAMHELILPHGCHRRRSS